MSRLVIFSWALYDLANQFFALNIVSLYFVRWLTLEKNTPEIFYSIAFGLSLVLVAIFGPFLGNLADRETKHRRFLVYFTLIAIFFTLLLGFSEEVILSLVFFSLANMGVQMGVIFYNSLLAQVSSPENVGFISGLGRMFGYSGAILALYLSKPVFLNQGYRGVFFLTGILFLLFSFPCMFFVKEKKEVISDEGIPGKTFFQFFSQAKKIFSQSKDFINLLKSAFFGFSAINVVILFMSVYASKVFGFSSEEVINLIIFSAFFALGGSLFFGSISDYLGYRNSLLAVFILWGVCFLGGSLLDRPFFWVIGALAGVSLGGVWVVCRALVVRLVKKEELGLAFGLFNLIGYLSGILGPLFWGSILFFTSSWGDFSYRIALFSLIFFILLSVIFLLRLPKFL
ncbi:MAG TPA: MFS transporter [Candidatus Omnitrophica bacterium]|nr:MAG: hypothetical protein DRP61_04735 [Candidatus Omnitrophota bacterium]RKY34647.1 MAG: hypothetical protein DRP69_04090 [Candidatus Omnitrophota bacterium]RKY42483.1 MAG: hypothetical protein DRP80_06735 [Candidatus Omnitrophota bacterium]HEC69832.1 MFS transporter [Candidatus Omnitrophota bacterium]